MKRYYRYASLMRPAGLGAVPRQGLIACEDCYGEAPSGHRMYSFADYDRPLTDKEISDYELEFCHMLEVEEND